MERFEITVIGAGVVGLSIASEISKKSKSVLVIERNNSFGMEISSRNSEVIHAGIYYPKDSLKARLCVEGNPLLYEWCAKNKIPHKKIGKLIVALDKTEEEVLEQLLENALDNGVGGIALLSKKKAKELEPHINVFSCLHSTSTGIIDSHALMQCLLSRSQEQGACISFNTCLQEIRKNQEGYDVTVLDADKEPFTFSSDIVVNSAGLEADTVAGRAGLDIRQKGYELSYCKGRYFRVSDRKRSLISRLIYPLPESCLVGLGIHATMNLTGSVRLGPDHVYVPRENFTYEVESEAKEEFYTAAKRYLPFLDRGDLSCDTAGIRPKLQSEGEAFRDFIIQEEKEGGFPGLINLVGIESPGLTACLAIAKHVAHLIWT